MFSSSWPNNKNDPGDLVIVIVENRRDAYQIGSLEAADISRATSLLLLLQTPGALPIAIPGQLQRVERGRCVAAPALEDLRVPC